MNEHINKTYVNDQILSRNIGYSTDKMALPSTKQDLYDLPPPNCPRGLSSFVKAGICLLTTANVDMLVAFSTGYWTTWSNSGTGEHGGYGLWMIWKCTNDVASDGQVDTVQEICNERMTDLSFPGWYVATQVFMTLCLCGFLASEVLLLMYMFMPSCHRNISIMSTLIGLCYLSGLFLFIGLLLFGFKVAEEIEEMTVTKWGFSWSFSLACTSFVLNQLAASLLVTEAKRLAQGVHDHGLTVAATKEELKPVWSPNT